MSLDILRDPRLRGVVWRDLLPLRPFEVVCELLLPIPWLLGTLLCFHFGQELLAFPLAFVFFLTGLRVGHNAFHYALGVPRWVTEVIMSLLSVLMLGSMHAIQFNHLRHHRDCLGEEDLEGMCAQMPWWQALLVGPWFPLRLHAHALLHGKRRIRCWVLIDLLLNLLWIFLVYYVWESAALRWHVAAMATGQCLTGFFAVWTVHHDCDRAYQIARTLRGRLKNWISFSMFFHVEHHLFPKVPTCRLPILAQRLDEVAPELQAKQVF